jgi:2-haloalkanoic acid dehalogenase type II
MQLGSMDPRPDGRAFDAVLFDMFGTLVDFRSTFNVTLRRILADLGLEDRSSVFLSNWRTFTFQGETGGAFITVHEDFRQGLETTLQGLGLGGDLGPYCREVIEDLFAHLRVAALFPEVRDVLAALERQGVSWAVVSNIDEDDLTSILRHHDLTPPTAVSSEAARSYKPDAGPFRAALDGMGVEGGRTLHVGDSPAADVIGAQRLGIPAAWVNRYMDPYPNEMPQPRFTIHDLSPVPSIVQGRHQGP